MEALLINRLGDRCSLIISQSDVMRAMISLSSANMPDVAHRRLGYNEPMSVVIPFLKTPQRAARRMGPISGHVTSCLTTRHWLCSLSLGTILCKFE